MIHEKLILQVHDELVFEVVESEVEQLQKLVVAGMSNAVKLKVPLEVTVASGFNWDQAH